MLFGSLSAKAPSIPLWKNGTLYIPHGVGDQSFVVKQRSLTYERDLSSNFFIGSNFVIGKTDGYSAQYPNIWGNYIFFNPYVKTSLYQIYGSNFYSNIHIITQTTPTKHYLSDVNQSVYIGSFTNSYLRSRCVAIGSSSNQSDQTTTIGHNSMTGQPGAVAIGDYASGHSSSSVTIGSSASVYGAYSVSIGYYSRVESSAVAACAFGSMATAQCPSEYVFSTGRFSTNGDAKFSLLTLRVQTVNASATKLGTYYLSGTTPSQYIDLTNDSSYIFKCTIIARNTGTDSETKAWELTYVVVRGVNEGTVSVIGTPIKNVLAQQIGTETWDVVVSVDAVNGRPDILVYGEVGKTIRWVANAQITKVLG